MATFVAILRGINVNGQNRLKMADLRLSLTTLGLEAVTTYIQSGNIIFNFNSIPDKTLANMIHNQILDDFGYSINVIIRTPKQLNQIKDNNPFLKHSAYLPAHLYVTFLEKTPNKIDLVKLSNVQTQDQFFHHKQHIFLYCLNGYARTKLTNNTIEKTLSMPATTRNWKTCSKLIALCGD